MVADGWVASGGRKKSGAGGVLPVMKEEEEVDDGPDGERHEQVGINVTARKLQILSLVILPITTHYQETVASPSPPTIEFADCSSEIASDDEDDFQPARSTPEEEKESVTSPPPLSPSSVSEMQLCDRLNSFARKNVIQVKLRRDEEGKKSRFGDWIGRRISFRRIGPVGGEEAAKKRRNSTASVPSQVEVQEGQMR